MLRSLTRRFGFDRPAHPMIPQVEMVSDHLMLRVTTHPMQLATNHGNLKLVRYLLTAGADKDAKSKHGKTAYDIARANRNDRLTKLLDPDAPLPDEAQQQEQQQQQQKQ